MVNAANLTLTSTTDERFFSLAARNPGGRAHVLFQASATNEAGVAVIGDRGASPGNLLRRIAYPGTEPRSRLRNRTGCQR